MDVHYALFAFKDVTPKERILLQGNVFDDRDRSDNTNGQVMSMTDASAETSPGVRRWSIVGNLVVGGFTQVDATYGPADASASESETYLNTFVNASEFSFVTKAVSDLDFMCNVVMHGKALDFDYTASTNLSSANNWYIDSAVHYQYGAHALTGVNDTNDALAPANASTFCYRRRHLSVAGGEQACIGGVGDVLPKCEGVTGTPSRGVDDRRWWLAGDTYVTLLGDGPAMPTPAPTPVPPTTSPTPLSSGEPTSTSTPSPVTPQPTPSPTAEPTSTSATSSTASATPSQSGAGDGTASAMGGVLASGGNNNNNNGLLLLTTVDLIIILAIIGAVACGFTALIMCAAKKREDR